MKDLEYTNKFRRDLKRIKKWDKDISKLEQLVSAMRSDKPLPVTARPHKLEGEWNGFWECHIEPDWVLIYDVTDEAVLLAGTGTHTDLFK